MSTIIICVIASSKKLKITFVCIVINSIVKQYIPNTMSN